MSKQCPSGRCAGGTKSLTVEFEMGPRNTLPCTLDNLSKVNFVHYEKRDMIVALCIGDPLTATNPEYDVIQFAADTEINIVEGFSPKARDAVVRLMRVITGQSFTIGFEDERSIIYWRKDLAEQIATFEQQKPKVE